MIGGVQVAGRTYRSAAHGAAHPTNGQPADAYPTDPYPADPPPGPPVSPNLRDLDGLI